MIRDITLGQYFPVDSIIHRLDARVKIVSTLIFIIALFVVNTFVGLGVATAFLLIIIKMSKVPLGFMLKGLKPIFFIVILTFVLNIFMIDGRVLAKWWIFTVTAEGLRQAIFMAVRLILLILGSSVLTFTTKPINLTDAIEYLLNPLKKIKVPVHELAMMMSIALRFIPTLLEETDKIIKAQQARGADFETGNIIKRAKRLVPILVPLFIGAFRIAQDMAMAMEARCYRGGEGRTKMHALKYVKRDYIAYLIMWSLLALSIVTRIMF
ncbi:MAG: energy-coupling factor transporter transmembrane component T [Eubacteriales bacterium]|nr:energy-coupling factor transporter transmembrane component T [Eubacteriales bacterium]MDY3333251.1 energy-coupling factor transporter transmembrane component T [Gallibacter sp.]